METYLKYFDDHDVFLDQKRVNVCEHMVKMASHENFLKVLPGGCKKGRGGEEGMEGKLNGNYLMLIPGLCLEDRRNWWEL